MSQATHCSICQRSFETVLAKKVHEQHTHIFVFKCKNCETKFASERNLSNHMSKCNETLRLQKGSLVTPVVTEERLKKYEERKRKADDQMEQYTELLKRMKNKKKDCLSDNKVETTKPTNFEKKEYKKFLGKLLQEAKAKVEMDEKSSKQSNTSLVDKDKMYQKLKQVFEDSIVSNKKTEDLSPSKIEESHQKFNEQSTVSEEVKKKSKAIVAFECSFCDALFKTKDTLRKHEEGHESQNNSDDEGSQNGDTNYSEEFKNAKRKSDLLPDILERKESLMKRSAALENVSNLKLKDAHRKAKLLPDIKKREEMLKRKLIKLKEKADSRQQKRAELAPAAVQSHQNRVLLTKKNSTPLKCTTYEYQEMLEKANKLESKKEEFEKLKLKLERIKKQAKIKQQKVVSSQEVSSSKVFESREEKLKPIQVFEKELIKVEPPSPVPEKYEAPEMDPNFQIKLEPEISIKEEPEEFIPEQVISKSDLKQTLVPSTVLTQAEKLEKYRALKAKLKQLKEANTNKAGFQKQIEGDLKNKTEEQIGKIEPVPDNSNKNVPFGTQGQGVEKAVVSETMSAAEKKLKARLAREETVREVHKRIEERKRIKEIEELEKQETKSRELVTELRREVEKVTQELEEYEIKQRKKSRKELKKHLKEKIVNTVNVEYESPAVTKEEKIEKIRELDEERENLQQKLEELNQRRLLLQKTSSKRLSEETLEPTVKSIKLEKESDVGYEKVEACSSETPINLDVLQVVNSENECPREMQYVNSKNECPKEVRDPEPQNASNLESSAPPNRDEFINKCMDSPNAKAATVATVSDLEKPGDHFDSKQKFNSMAENTSDNKSDSPKTKTDMSDILKTKTDKSEDSMNTKLAYTNTDGHVLEENEKNLDHEKKIFEEETQNYAFPHASQGGPCNEEEWKGQIGFTKLCEEKSSVSMDAPNLEDVIPPVKTNVGNPCDSDESDDEANALDIKYDEYESEDDDEVGNVFEVSTEDGDEQWKKVEIKKSNKNPEIDEKQSVNITPIIIDDLYISDDSEEDDDPEIMHYLSSGCKYLADKKLKNGGQETVSSFPSENEDDEYSNDAEEVNDLPASSEFSEYQTLSGNLQETSSLVEVRVCLSSDNEEDIDKNGIEEKNHDSEEIDLNISMSTSIKEAGQSNSDDTVHPPLGIDECGGDKQISLSPGTDDVQKGVAQVEIVGEVNEGKEDQKEVTDFVEEKEDTDKNHPVDEEEISLSLSAYTEEVEKDDAYEGGSTPVHDFWNDFGIEEATDQELQVQQSNLGSTQVCNLQENNSTVGHSEGDLLYNLNETELINWNHKEDIAGNGNLLNGVEETDRYKKELMTVTASHENNELPIIFKEKNIDVHSLEEKLLFSTQGGKLESDSENSVGFMSSSEDDDSDSETENHAVNIYKEETLKAKLESHEPAVANEGEKYSACYFDNQHMPNADDVSIYTSLTEKLLTDSKWTESNVTANLSETVATTTDQEDDSGNWQGEIKDSRQKELFGTSSHKEVEVTMSHQEDAISVGDEQLTVCYQQEELINNTNKLYSEVFNEENELLESSRGEERVDRLYEKKMKTLNQDENYLILSLQGNVSGHGLDEEKVVSMEAETPVEFGVASIPELNMKLDTDLATNLLKDTMINMSDSNEANNSAEQFINKNHEGDDNVTREETLNEQILYQNIEINTEKICSVEEDGEDSDLSRYDGNSDVAYYYDTEKNLSSQEGEAFENNNQAGEIPVLDHPVSSDKATNSKETIKLDCGELNHESDFSENMEVGCDDEYEEPDARGDPSAGGVKKEERISERFSQDMEVEDVSGQSREGIIADGMQLTGNIEDGYDDSYEEPNASGDLRDGQVWKEGDTANEFSEDKREAYAAVENGEEIKEPKGNIEKGSDNTYKESNATGDLVDGEIREYEHTLNRFSEDMRGEDTAGENEDAAGGNGEEIKDGKMEHKGNIEKESDDACEESDATGVLADGEIREEEHSLNGFPNYIRGEDITGENGEESPENNQERYDDAYEKPDANEELKDGEVREEGHTLNGFSEDLGKENASGDNEEKSNDDVMVPSGSTEEHYDDTFEESDVGGEVREQGNTLNGYSEYKREEDGKVQNREEIQNEDMEPVVNEEDSESETDLNEDELCDKEYEDMWEDENDLKDVSSKTNTGEQSAILNKIHDDINDEDSDSDEEEWISLDNAQNLLSDKEDVNEFGKDSLNVQIYKPGGEEGLLDILDHTWEEASKFEKLFSSEDNGAEILEMFYSGQLTRAELLGCLPSLGWVGKTEAKFLPSGWFMKMTGPIAYTFITDVANICESAFDAFEHMVSKEYSADAVQAFENYCTNFTELDMSAISEETLGNKEENIDERRHFKPKQNQLKDTEGDDEVLGEDIMEEDALSDSDDDGNDESVDVSVKSNEGCSFDDALSDSDDDFDD